MGCRYSFVYQKHEEMNYSKNGQLFITLGAFYSLAVVAEGCSENIMRKYLVDFLKCIDAGIQHQSPVVRNSALYALGQFSEYLQVHCKTCFEYVVIDRLCFSYFDVFQVRKDFSILVALVNNGGRYKR